MEERFKEIKPESRESESRKPEERRSVERIAYFAKSEIIECDSHKRYEVEIDNVSPVGMGLYVPIGTPDLVGKSVIIVSETIIMYADVVRQSAAADNRMMIGIRAKRFTNDILEYLYNTIGIKDDTTN